MPQFLPQLPSRLNPLLAPALKLRGSKRLGQNLLVRNEFGLKRLVQNLRVSSPLVPNGRALNHPHAAGVRLRQRFLGMQHPTRICLLKKKFCPNCSSLLPSLSINPSFLPRRAMSMMICRPMSSANDQPLNWMRKGNLAAAVAVVGVVADPVGKVPSLSLHVSMKKTSRTTMSVGRGGKSPAYLGWMTISIGKKSTILPSMKFWTSTTICPRAPRERKKVGLKGKLAGLVGVAVVVHASVKKPANAKELSVANEQGIVRAPAKESVPLLVNGRQRAIATPTGIV